MPRANSEVKMHMRFIVCPLGAGDLDMISYRRSALASKVSLGQIAGLCKRFGFSLQREATELEHVAIFGGFERHPRILFDQQDRQAGLVKRLHQPEYLADKQRAQSE